MMADEWEGIERRQGGYDWHGLDRRVAIVETRVEHIDGELTKISAAMESLLMRVDGNRQLSQDNLAAVMSALQKHERWEDTQNQSRFDQHLKAETETRRWLVGVALTVATSSLGWLLHTFWGLG